MASKHFLTLVGILSLVVLAGCASEPVRSPSPGPDWSRGLQVGECSFHDLVALYPESHGERVHLAWGQVSPEGDSVRYVVLDAQARVIQDRALPFPVRSPRQVRLVPGGAGGLVVCWLSGVSEKRRLYAAPLDPPGAPTQISAPDLEVNDYAAVAGQAGIEVFWSHNGQGPARGVYHVRLDHRGQPLAPGKRIIAGAISPDAQVAGDGSVHLAWIYEPGYNEEQVFYARYDPQTQALATPVQVGSFNISLKVSRYGPVLALSKDRAYIFWSWEHLVSPNYAYSAAAAGEAECRYAILPLDSASEAPEEQVLAVPLDPYPDYQPAQGVYGYSRLAQIHEGDRSLVTVYNPMPVLRTLAGTHTYSVMFQAQEPRSLTVYMPNPAPGQRAEAALSLAFQTSTQTRQYVQIGVVYLAGDGVKGYQIAGRSGMVAMRPVLAADDEGQLHLAWLEPGGFNRYLVHYASTRPAVRVALGKVSRQDVASAALSAGWGLVQGVSMLPIALPALFPAFVWVVLYYLFKADGQLTDRGPRIALAVAIVLYLLSKLFLLPPSLLVAAPFAEQAPPVVADAIVIILPVAILAAGLGALRLYRRRAESPSLLAGYLVFAATDALLTCILYAPGMLR